MVYMYACNWCLSHLNEKIYVKQVDSQQIHSYNWISSIYRAQVYYEQWYAPFIDIPTIYCESNYMYALSIGGVFLIVNGALGAFPQIIIENNTEMPQI